MSYTNILLFVVEILWGLRGNTYYRIQSHTPCPHEHNSHLRIDLYRLGQVVMLPAYFRDCDSEVFCRIESLLKGEDTVIRQEVHLWSTRGYALAGYASMLAGNLKHSRRVGQSNVVN